MGRANSQALFGALKTGLVEPGQATPFSGPVLMSDLEKFIHDQLRKDEEVSGQGRGLLPLVGIALVHAQFETMHPFLDGNGRMGRLLISALLEDLGLLPEPMMYLSGYLNEHQRAYYRLLSGIRVDETVFQGANSSVLAIATVDSARPTNKKIAVARFLRRYTGRQAPC